jgi:hypothetical protein
LAFWSVAPCSIRRGMLLLQSAASQPRRAQAACELLWPPLVLSSVPPCTHDVRTIKVKVKANS